MDEDEARALRAEARLGRTQLRWLRASEERAEAESICGPEAISLVRALSEQSWSLSGKPMPHYTRNEIPVSFVARQS